MCIGRLEHKIMKRTTAIRSGNIAPVSDLTAQTMMCLYLERFTLLAGIMRKPSKPAAQPCGSPGISAARAVAVASAIVMLLALIFMAVPTLRAQSTINSVRGTSQNVTIAAIPDRQVTLHLHR
jgi:hypothetical protein